MIIFGAGDLLHRKLMPSLFHLMEDGLLPDDFTVITVARESLDDGTFRTQVGDAIRTFLPNGATADKAGIANFTETALLLLGRAERRGHLRHAARSGSPKPTRGSPAEAGGCSISPFPRASMPARSTCWRNRASPRE